MNDFTNSFGLESIAVQTDGFDVKLTEWVDELRILLETNKHTSPAVNTHVKKFNTMIKDRFNMHVNLKILRDIYNPWSAIPILNVNQGILNNVTRKLASVDVFYKQFDEAFKRKPLGWIDLKTAKVYGVYSEISSNIGIGLTLLKDTRIDSRGIAGIILHEIGHIFDTYSNASIMETYTRGLSEIYRAFTGISDPENRKVILEYLDHKNYIKIPHENIDKIVKLDPNKAVQVIVADRVIELKSQTGIKTYEIKLAEQGADVFASRFGFNRDFVLAVSKLNGPSISRSMHWFIQTLMVSSFAIGLFLSPIIVTAVISLLTWGNENSGSLHDNDKDRFDKLRQQIIIRLKNPDLDKESRESLLSELAAIDKVLKIYKDNVGFFTALGRLMVKSYRTKNRQNELLYHLERMANNKLFESASKFKNLL